MASADEQYSDDSLHRILTECRTIAMVGASDDPARDSHGVMRYLQQNGYRVIPVNPTIAGDELLGEVAYSALADIPHSFDLVDVFRKVEAVPGIVDEVLSLREEKEIQVLWLQLGIADTEAAERARAGDITVVMNRCLKIEHSRLMRRS